MSDYFNRLAGKQHEDKANLNREEEKARIREEIQKRLPGFTQNQILFGMKKEEDLAELKGFMSTIIRQVKTTLPVFEQEILIKDMVLEITNLGKISPLMDDPTVTEVMINGPKEVWVERSGSLERTNIIFHDDEQVMDLARKIVSFVGRMIDPLHPYVDARLPDGSRVHIIIPPVARKGVTITIRKFFTERLTIDNLIGFNTLTPQMARFLQKLVLARANVLVSGGTGSGKTTTLNVLSNFIPDYDRAITVEDSAELQLNCAHVVPLETKNANAEGKGEVSIQALVKNTLRMRPDRIVVGEVRDHTAYDLLNAMNTGHDGSLATLHANDPDSAVDRLVNLVLERGMQINFQAVRSLVANAVDIVVQISRMSDHKRRIEYVSEVSISNEGRVETHPIFMFDVRSVGEKGEILGEFIRTDYTPSKRLLNKFRSHGIDAKELGI